MLKGVGLRGTKFIQGLMKIGHLAQVLLLRNTDTWLHINHEAKEIIQNDSEVREINSDNLCQHKLWFTCLLLTHTHTHTRTHALQTAVTLSAQWLTRLTYLSSAPYFSLLLHFYAPLFLSYVPSLVTFLFRSLCSCFCFLYPFPSIFLQQLSIFLSLFLLPFKLPVSYQLLVFFSSYYFCWQVLSDRDRWRALVNAVMNLQVPHKCGEFLV